MPIREHVHWVVTSKSRMNLNWIWHEYPLHVTHFALKCYDIYNLTGVALHLLRNPFHPILKPVWPLFTVETYRKDLARKWIINCRFEYIGPSFPSSILNQILVCFSTLLSLSRYLVISPKMPQCALVDAPLRICAHSFISWLRLTASHSMPSHFW